MAKPFQWLRNSPMLFFRTDLGVEECLGRLQVYLDGSDDVPGGEPWQGKIKGTMDGRRAELHKVDGLGSGPAFHAKMTRLEEGALISGYFALRTGEKATLVLLSMLALPFFGFPFMGDDFSLAGTVICWGMGVLVLGGLAYVKVTPKETVRFFIQLFAEGFEAELTRRVE